MSKGLSCRSEPPAHFLYKFNWSVNTAYMHNIFAWLRKLSCLKLFQVLSYIFCPMLPKMHAPKVASSQSIMLPKSHAPKVSRSQSTIFQTSHVFNLTCSKTHLLIYMLPISHAPKDFCFHFPISQSYMIPRSLTPKVLYSQRPILPKYILPCSQNNKIQQ